jgi:uncharacterized repeat protein (TIGR03803 family)
MTGKRIFMALRSILAAFALLLLAPGNSAVAQEKILHSFKTNADPYGSLIFDAAGNLYGTTRGGGTHGAGTVFELMPKAGGGWTEKILHSFDLNGNDGWSPQAGLIFDSAGNLYGTTPAGGTYTHGTVFELSPKSGGGWTEKVLHDFENGTDGSTLYDGLTIDASGNLYGTSPRGGSYDYGNVFELTPKAGGVWTLKVLHSFNKVQGKDGVFPYAGVIFDSLGNLYGTTVGGYNDWGTVFELMPETGGGWTEKLVHDFFPTNQDGSLVYAGVVFDTEGNLYGATELGGTYHAGKVFELSPRAGGGWTEEVLHNFMLGTDGFYPQSSVTLDTAGNVYGTTPNGGAYGGGTVFELTLGSDGWTEKILYSFGASDKDGYAPQASLILDAAGNLYGTTAGGGALGGGTVFEIKH